MEYINQRIVNHELIYDLSNEDSDKSFFVLKNYLVNRLNLKIEVRMGGVMDEFYGSFFWNNINLKLEYCNWTGTELKASKYISELEKSQLDKFVLELIQELKRVIS